MTDVGKDALARMAALEARVEALEAVQEPAGDGEWERFAAALDDETACRGAGTLQRHGNPGTGVLSIARHDGGAHRWGGTGPSIVCVFRNTHQ